MLLEFSWSKLDGEEIGELGEGSGVGLVEKCPPAYDTISSESEGDHNLAVFGDAGTFEKEVHTFEKVDNGKSITFAIEGCGVREFE